jgi:hypothetical protein
MGSFRESGLKSFPSFEKGRTGGISEPKFKKAKVIQKLKYVPSPCPLPQGEREKNIEIQREIPSPLTGGDRVGVENGFFHTFRARVGVIGGIFSHFPAG